MHKNQEIVKLAYKNKTGNHYTTGEIPILKFKPHKELAKKVSKITKLKLLYPINFIFVPVNLNRKILKANKKYKMELEIGLNTPVELEICSKEELNIGDVVDIIVKEYKKQKRRGNLKDYYSLKNISIYEIVVRRNRIIPEIEGLITY